MSDAVEIAGHGVQILVDGVMTYVGNEKLMKNSRLLMSRVKAPERLSMLVRSRPF